jgi:hypothetical protein
MGEMQFSDALKEELKHLLIGMINKADVVYFDQYHNEIGRDHLGDVTPGQEIDWVILTNKGWGGLKFSMKIYTASILYLNLNDQEVFWNDVGRVDVGMCINIVVPTFEDFRFDE